MDLNIYDVIKGPVISDKALRQNKDQNKLMLKVHPEANKIQIKSALQQLFNVKVKKVNTLRRKGKVRLVNRRPVQGNLEKRVIVTLAEGYSLDLFDQSGSSSITVSEAKK